MAVSAAAVPASLKAIKPYIERAAEVQSKDAIVAYHLRLYALQEAMAKRADVPKADMGFIITLMDALETEKAGLGPLEDAAMLVENFGQEIFSRADDADRAGHSGINTGKAYRAAFNVLESCAQFGELPSDLSEKIKYAKWRAVEIFKAIKERREPAPPRSITPEPEPDDEAGGGQEGAAGGSGGQEAADPALPSYMSLPEPTPELAPPQQQQYHPPPQYPPPPQHAYPPPPAAGGYGGGSPAPPAHPQPPTVSAPSSFGMPSTPPPSGTYRPAVADILQASRLVQTALSALQFQDVDTAVPQLAQALQQLTQPRPATPPPAPR